MSSSTFVKLFTMIAYLLLFCSVALNGVRENGEQLVPIFWDTVTQSGGLTGGTIQMRVEKKTNEILRSGVAGVTQLINNGPSSNRIDLVFVGDGYTIEELVDFEEHVNNILDEDSNNFLYGLFEIEPFKEYRALFNVHRVDVVSNESGVDNDPNDPPGTLRDTAMDMLFYTLTLGVDYVKAWGFANNVQSADFVFAFANSTSYGGGAAYPNLATVTGNSFSTGNILIHEFGHLFGLIDEYSGDQGTYPDGIEPWPSNVSAWNYSEMDALGAKWANWLGELNEDGRWGGRVATYEGAWFYDFGIYRPTASSMMRSLGVDFNQPSVETMIIDMYRYVQPIDDHTPLLTQFTGCETVFVDPVDVEHPMDIQWFLDGVPVGVQGQPTLDLSLLSTDKGNYWLTVEVVDPTPWVRNEDLRESVMKQQLTWNVNLVGCPADFNSDGSVDVSDLLSVFDVWGPCSSCVEDIVCDSVVDTQDLLAVIGAWGVCP